MDLKYFTVFTSGHHDTSASKKDWSDEDVDKIFQSTLLNKNKIPFTVKHPKNESNLPIVAYTDSNNIRLIKENGKSIIQARATEVSDKSIFNKLKDIFGNKISVRLNADNYGIEHLGMTPTPAVTGVDNIPFESNGYCFEIDTDLNNDYLFSDEINSAALTHAKSLINSGDVDTKSDWSFSGDDGNKLLGNEGKDWANYGKWFLVQEASEKDETKARFKYPFGKDGKIYRGAVIAIKQRAAQQNDNTLESEAGKLLDEINKKYKLGDDNKKDTKDKQVINNFTKEITMAKCKTCGANPDGGKCEDCGADTTGSAKFSKGACPDCGANPKGGECQSCGAKPPKAKEEFSADFEKTQLEFNQMRQEIEELKFEKVKLEFEKFLDSDNIKGIAIPAMRPEAFKLLKILPKESYEFESNGTTIKEQPIDILKSMIAKMKPSLNFSHDFTPGQNAYNENRDGRGNNGKRWDDATLKAAKKLNGSKLPEGVM